MKKKDPWRNVSADKFILKKQLKEVTAQRDALLAALENAVNEYLAGNDVWGGIQEARDAIAAVKSDE